MDIMKSSNFVKVVTLFLFFAAIPVGAQTSEFTFQGKLYESGAPVSTPRDMIFRLWDETNTTQLGSDITVNNVPFNNGVFTVRLDFGVGTFDGSDRWIETLISLPGVNDYTTLAPRQKFTSAPYAIRSLTADSARTATNAEQLGEIPADQYVVTTDVRLSDLRYPLPGSGDYIQNQSGQQQTANFELNGIGKATYFDALTYRINGTTVLYSDGANLVVGPDSGGSLSGGNNNSFVGILSGTQNGTGNFNTFTGNYSGQYTTSGSDNSFYGGQSGRNNLTGNGNSFYGRYSGFINNEGSQNSFVGYYAGSGNTTGDNNSALGAHADVLSNTLSFATAIGSHSKVSADDTIVLGKTAGTYNGTERPADTVLIPGTLIVDGTFSSSILGAVTHFNIGSDRVLSVEGDENVFVGVNAGQNNLGQGNTFVGRDAGRVNASGYINSFFGRRAGAANTGGHSNSFFGSYSGQNNTTGNYNSFFGTSSGGGNTTGFNNSFFGVASGLSNTTGDSNSFFGYSSGSFNSSGLRNSFFGFESGDFNMTGQSNAFFGYQSGRNNQTGGGNSFFGSNSGLANVNGLGNTLIGYNTNLGAGNLSFATAIGAGAIVTSINRIQLGRNNVDTVSIGRLDATGTVHICVVDNVLTACSSSLRYKENIRPLAHGLSIIQRFRPVVFKWKERDEHDIGLIAEEAAEIEPLLATYNENGEIEGIKYDQISVILINAVKEQQEQIEGLQKQIEQAGDATKLREEVESLKKENRQLSAELKELRKLICSAIPSAATCSPKEEQK